MSQPILQAFLNQNVITIDQNDEFTFMTKAAVDFEKRLRTKKSRVSRVAQVAFDPNTQPDEPVVAEVQELITSKWKAFPSKCNDKPVPYVRAVMLAALQSLSADVTYAGIIWLTVSNYFPYAGLAQREAALLSELLGEVGDLYQQASWSIWGIGGNYSSPEAPSIPKNALPTANSVSEDYVVKQMAAAAGGSAEGSNDNIIFSFYNQYQGNNQAVKPAPEWVAEFGKIAGAAVKKTADILAVSVNKSLSEAASLKQLDAYTAEITRYLRQVGENMSQQTASHNLRSRLLWLKESMYSTGRQTSYRKIPLAVVGTALANDVVEIVPAIYPVSVDFFLRETLNEANSESDSTCTFEELLSQLVAERTLLLEVLPSAEQPDTGRMSLLTFIRALVAGTIQTTDFEKTTGLRLTDTINWQGFAVWIFRELQVLKLAAVK